MSRNFPEENPKFAETFQLGAHVFSLKTGELRDASGAVAPLRRQSADVLSHLLRHAGEIVSKEALFGTVWAGSAVTDDSLVQCISEIRRRLEDRDHRIIQTESKKGYRIQATPLWPSPAGATGAQPTLAVLAFDDYSVGADRGFLSDAIAEGVTAELSRFPELAVIARNSSFSLRGGPAPATEIAARLGARYLLEGSQQKNGDRLRVTVQLIDADEDRHIWSETYDRDLDEPFRAQDDIVRSVVATTAQKLIKHEAGAAIRSPAANRSALQHHLEARQHVTRLTPEGNEKARIANLAAIKADPAAPFGYAGLAFVYINGFRWGWSPLGRDEALDEARRMACKAVELAPDYYDGHAAMAYVHLQDNDLDRAIACAERALALNPNDTNVMCDLAEYLGYASRTDEAEALLRRAMRMDPLYPDWIRWNMAWVQWLGGKNEAALKTMNAMSEIPPMANRVLAPIYMSLGRRDDARRTVRRLMERQPGYSLADVKRNYIGKFKDEAQLDRVLTLLKEAGLPE